MSEISIRVATPDDARGISRVKVETWRFAYKNILIPETLAGLDIEKEAARWHDRLSQEADGDRCWVACYGDEIVGFLYMGPNRFAEVDCDGELQAIYLLPSYHRQGLGRQMLKVGVDWMVAQGFQSMAVFVFRDNPLGVNFYKSTGAVFHDTGSLEIGGHSYPDESYVWKSLIGLQQLLSE